MALISFVLWTMLLLVAFAAIIGPGAIVAAPIAALFIVAATHNKKQGADK